MVFDEFWSVESYTNVTRMILKKIALTIPYGATMFTEIYGILMKKLFFELLLRDSKYV